MATLCTCAELTLYWFVAVDPKGDVFVDGASGSFSRGYTPLVVEWPAHSSGCRILPAQLSWAGTVQITNAGDLMVGDSQKPVAITYGHPKFKKIIATTGFGNVKSSTYFTHTDDNRDVWTANYQANSVTRFQYPQGGLPRLTISGLSGPMRVFAVPCPAPNC